MRWFLPLSIAAAALSAGAVALWLPTPRETPLPVVSKPHRAAEPVAVASFPLPTLGVPRFDPERGVYVAPFGRGLATLSLEPALQQRLERTLREGRPQWGATAVVEIATGRVVALAESSEREPDAWGAAVRPLGKAASVFKLVSAAALVEGGVDTDEVICTSGGKTRLYSRNLVDNARRDTRCLRFFDAVPLSQNVVIGKLAARSLEPVQLRNTAQRLGFFQPLAPGLPVEASRADIPDDDRLGFATTAAGFGDVYMSALHGAVLAQAIANDGVLLPPRLIEHVDNERNVPVAKPRRALQKEHAEVLQDMMTATVARGTASRAFASSHSLYGRIRPIPVPVAGKTGSLTDRDVDLDYTWFVGFAPAHAPKYAFATVVINDEWIWHVRALDVVRVAVGDLFDLHPGDDVAVAAAPGGSVSPGQRLSP